MSLLRHIRCTSALTDGQHVGAQRCVTSTLRQRCVNAVARAAAAISCSRRLLA